MPITKPTRPALIASGAVVVVTPRTRYDREAGRYSDEVIGHEVTISQIDGAQMAVRYPLADADKRPIPVPALLTPIHVVAELSESREYGASLTFVRNVTADDLDRINSDLSVGASK